MQSGSCNDAIRHIGNCRARNAFKGNGIRRGHRSHNQAGMRVTERFVESLKRTRRDPRSFGRIDCFDQRNHRNIYTSTVTNRSLDCRTSSIGKLRGVL